MSAEAIGRVREYVRQFDRLKDTGGRIHEVYTDKDAESAPLFIADLKALLAAVPQELPEGRKEWWQWTPPPTHNHWTCFLVPGSAETLCGLSPKDAMAVTHDASMVNCAACTDGLDPS
ncbi:hypothetical protein ACMX2H_18325 [Arthrobacter sulfonylureivorans]|uniref:hypothetical protein n=1 Tax=Arthrobacter sulfonylureivorans TaxID=2486855 RepID=UPI0039E339AF